MGVYHIKNKGTSTYLYATSTTMSNHLGLSVAAKVTNDFDLTKFKWSIRSLSEKTLIRSVLNPQYTLNAYRNTLAPFTCDLYDYNINDDKDCKVTIVSANGYQRILLDGWGLYLTVVNGTLKWCESDTSNNNQLWTLEYLGNMGCDTSAYLSSTRAGKLDAYDFTFVGRYLNLLTGYHDGLTSAEVNNIMNTNMFIYSLYQDNMPSGTTGFTATAGLNHATNAVALATAINQPANTPIYFAVDRNFSESQCADITDYFDAIKEYLDSSDNNPNGYKLGVYSSGLLCEYVLDNIDSTAFTMKRNARADLGYDYTDWNIYQNTADITFSNCDFPVDMNLSATKGGGGWRISTN